MTWDLKKYIRDDNGQVAVIFSLAVLPLLALTSAAVDYSQITKERNAISSALDAAVLAAANNNAISLAEKSSYAEAHFLDNYSGNLQLSLTPSVTSSRVRLVANGELDLVFGNLVGIDNPKLTEASAATISQENTICVLSLSENDDASISFDRDMEFLASGCAVHSNSQSTTAILAENKLSLPKASSFCAVGGISGEVEPHSKGECGSVSDPYVNVEPAPLEQCKTQVKAFDETPGAFNPDSNTQGDNGGVLFQRLQGIPYEVFPSPNRLPATYIQEQLDIQFGKEAFRAKRDNASPDTNGLAMRTGNATREVKKLSKLDGPDLRKLLDAYEAYDGRLNCGSDPKPECFGYDNPFVDAEYKDVPSRWLAEEVFLMSNGDLLPPVPDSTPASPGTGPAIPDIVRLGLVELIDGNLYSRNNIDGELVPVSKNLTGGDIQLTPGTYCGGLTVDGLRVRFAPGDYIFKDGPLTFLNKSKADADRVTFGFRGAGATLNIESGSTLKIRSAVEGPRKGLAFMQVVDADAPGNRSPIQGTNRISSGGSISMSGTAYFPEQTLLISGENTHLGSSSPAVGLIANKIAFRGARGSRVAIAVDHQKAGIPPIQPQVDDGVRLIE